MRVTLVHNPNAGDEEHGADALRSLLAAAGHQVRYTSVKEDGWESALAEPTELVVAAGGDGTVRRVFKALARNGFAAAVLPLGSANNIARTLGVADAELEQLVRAWDGAERRRYDVGTASAPWGEVQFVESFGGGIFAELLLGAKGVQADGEEKLELGLRLLRDALEQAPLLPWTVAVDGADLSGELAAAEAMNVRTLGPNVPLAPDADPGDGLLDVVLIGAGEREPLLAYVEERLAGRDPDPPRLPGRRGTTATIRPPADCPLHVDDQLWPLQPERRGDGTVVVTAGRASVELLAPVLDT